MIYIKIASLNCRGQTKFPVSKQLQIEDFIKSNNIDILCCQETNIQEDSFTTCNFIQSNFSIVKNNASNDYGTCCIVKNNFEIKNIVFDTTGRIILFDIDGLTLGNFYLPAGLDGDSRRNRESMLADIIPNLIINKRDSGIMLGDWNCIIHRKDSTKNQEAKTSQNLKKLAKIHNLKDVHQELHPNSVEFSRYYVDNLGDNGASRIDRAYYYGEGISPLSSTYQAVAFSDHLSLIISVKIQNIVKNRDCPKSRPFFKISPTVVNDPEFKERLEYAIKKWVEIKEKFNHNHMDWWEGIVKPGIRKMALTRSKEINKSRRGQLNLLLLQQTFFLSRFKKGNKDALISLKETQNLINNWFQEEADRTLIQIGMDEIDEAEEVRIFHHDLHKKRITRSAILELETETGVLDGHVPCAEYLNNNVKELLENSFVPDRTAADTLLAELGEEFTEDDNEKLLASPDKEEVWQVIKSSNLHAAPGKDSITNYLYYKHFAIIGDALTQTVKCIHEDEFPTKSQRTSLMVFANKPKKAASIKPSDKRKISLLNTDFKVITGIEAKRHASIMDHTVAEMQFAAGKNKRIHQAISLARDAIWTASRRKEGGGIADLDFQSAFDLLCMNWILEVMKKKGMDDRVIHRLQRIYSNGITITVINNIPMKEVKNVRGTLRQGDCPSSFWFAYGIDPLIRYLQQRLEGLPMTSVPRLGPAEKGSPRRLPPLEIKYKVVGYCDDIKPAISKMSEFFLVDAATSLFEKASGCRLH